MNTSLAEFDGDYISREVTNRFTTKYQVSEQLVSILSNLQRNPDSFETTLFDNISLREIFSYLKASHIYYLNTWMPKIDHTISGLRHKQDNGSVSVQILSGFLMNYQNELRSHIYHEESVLFDFAEDLLNDEYNSEKKNFVLNHFLFTHNDNVIVHLSELKNDLMKVEKSLESNFAFHILFNQLEIFQRDLLIHGLIEDTIFIPKMLKLIHDKFESLEQL